MCILIVFFAKQKKDKRLGMYDVLVILFLKIQKIVVFFEQMYLLAVFANFLSKTVMYKIEFFSIIDGECRYD